VKKNQTFYLLSFFLLVVLTSPVRSQDASESLSSPTSKIAFVSKRDGNSEIYTINPNGSELIRLTNNSFEDTFPVWSPDASSIAFVSDRDGSSNIYIMKPDGTEVHRLTDHKGEQNMPTWSPTGMQIAYTTDIGREAAIYVVNIDGSNPKELLVQAMAPSWSPDGQQFALNRGQIPQIFIMDADGSNVHPFFPEESDQTFLVHLSPIWSPDGESLLFTGIGSRKGTSPMNSDIVIVNKSGENQIKLNDYDGQNVGTDWSPDGTQIVFVSDRDGNSEIYIMNSDGTKISRLTNHQAVDTLASWSPIPEVKR